MQLFQTISRKSLSIWLSLLCMLSLWSSFSLSASAEDTIPFPIAWQQSEGSGAKVAERKNNGLPTCQK